MFFMSCIHRTRIEHNITILLLVFITYIRRCAVYKSAKAACFTLGEKTLAAYQKKKKKREK